MTVDGKEADAGKINEVMDAWQNMITNPKLTSYHFAVDNDGDHHRVKFKDHHEMTAFFKEVANRI
jgi:hypothetical protein